MRWGTVELQPEVARWLEGLSDTEFGHVAFYIDLLEERGVQLEEPYSRQLRGKLRELRFYLGRKHQRVTYYIAAGRRIILLTVFRKTKAKETAELNRAAAAMMRCVAESHPMADEG